VPARYGDLAAFLGREAADVGTFTRLRRAESTGRPPGADGWIEQLEKQTGRTLKPRKRGPERKVADKNKCIW